MSSSSLPSETRQWVLQNKPTDFPDLSSSSSKSTFKLATNSLPLPLKPTQVLLKTLYLSNDPAQRGWISASADPARLYVPPVAVGAPMRARAIAEVLDVGSEVTSLKKNDRVLAGTNWSEYAVMEGKECIPIKEIPGVNLTQYLGALGTTGLTAYYGLVEVVRTTKDDVVVVSGAAGATGSMVVQIAKRMLGCKRVIGIAGGAEKCRWVVETLGADECLDYKSGSFKEDLVRATPDFANVYFDNVGGDILDTMLTRMARHGRVAACGAISNYNNESQPEPMKNWFEVIITRIEIKGFIVLDYLHKAREVTEKFVQAVKEGKMVIGEEMETVVETDFEGIPKTWMGLFEGSNRGKLVTKLV